MLNGLPKDTKRSRSFLFSSNREHGRISEQEYNKKNCREKTTGNESENENMRVDFYRLLSHYGNTYQHSSAILCVDFNWECGEHIPIICFVIYLVFPSISLELQNQRATEKEKQ